MAQETSVWKMGLVPEVSSHFEPKAILVTRHKGSGSENLRVDSTRHMSSV